MTDLDLMKVMLGATWESIRDMAYCLCPPLRWLDCIRVSLWHKIRQMWDRCPDGLIYHDDVIRCEFWRGHEGDHRATRWDDWGLYEHHINWASEGPERGKPYVTDIPCW